MFGIVVKQAVRSVARHPRVKGKIGELTTDFHLSRLSTEYTTINNVLIPRCNGSTAQIDHVVVSPYRIFIVESKRYTNVQVYGRTSVRNWMRVSASGSRKFYSPVWQNGVHIQALQEIYGDKELSVFVNLVAFGRSAQLRVTGTEWVGYMDQLPVEIGRYSDVRLDNEDIRYVVEKFAKYRNW